MWPSDLTTISDCCVYFWKKINLSVLNVTFILVTTTGYLKRLKDLPSVNNFVAHAPPAPLPTRTSFAQTTSHYDCSDRHDYLLRHLVK